MLESLHISNYALIDEVNIDFHPGLNIITGETGAGKSIMLGALSLILGGRADTRSVADPTRKSVIEVSFALGDYPALRRFCEENDIEWDDTHCLLRREINASTGRSRAFVNDSPVPLAKLASVAEFLIDIHSQHQNQLLARPDFQRQVIDTLAGNADRLSEHARRYAAFRDSMRRMKAAQAALTKAREDEEYTLYQLRQLVELNLTEGEQEELERERDRLSNLTDLRELMDTAIQALDADESGVIEQLHTAVNAVDDLQSVLDPNDQLDARLTAVIFEITDIVNSLQRASSSLQADPARLDDVEQRLSAIYEMQHKHHVTTDAELIAIRKRLQSHIKALNNSDITLRTLAREARRLKALASESAVEIGAARQAAAQQLARDLTDKARPLGMKNLQAEISVTPAELSATGANNVDFLFSFNKNQEPISVASGASGGEISRLMLTLKAIIASRVELPSIIFDEIDTGVSGDVANRMGAMMRSISDSIQVIAITHLPAVAAKGDHHYKVYKEDDDTSTHTHIRALTPAERVSELALMLSGSATDPAALANARALLEKSK